MITLYLKTHNVTGLKYLGKTTGDPYKYSGSGKHWVRHLNKHGYNVTTEILLETTSKDALKEKGLYYSTLWNVIESAEFANLRAESGDGGDTSSTDGYISGMQRWQESLEFAENKKQLSVWQKTRIANGLNPICGKSGKENPMFGKTKESHHGFGIPRSPETKKKIAENHQDVNGPRNANAKTYEFIDPSGNKYIVTGEFRIFCKEHNLSYATMFNVVYKMNRNPLRGNCKNWKVKKL